MSARILVVEDEAAIQELIAINLRHAGFSVTCVASAEAAEAALREALPDVLIVDWMLPGRSGLALARQLRAEARTRQLPLVMLTARAHEEDKVAGLEAGADDYLTKPFSPKEMVARIRALLRRRLPHLADAALCAGTLSLNPATCTVLADGQPVALAPGEFRLLAFLMAHPGRVHSRRHLLDAVWGEQAFVEERTVDVHIRRLRAALEAAGHALRIETVRGSGYRWCSD